MTARFDDLRRSIPDATVLVPGDAGYEDSLFRWSASCIKRAAVVVQPNTAFEVSVAIQYAAEHQVFPLAVRGGGHSTSGDSSSNGGMVIDLACMRSTSVDALARTITFGGGCTWEDVNSALWEHKLATVSGTVGDTGVGGLILGGGYGYLTGSCGLALDCLLGCEVVLANGDIVVANKDENADLFWALRGAGTNFGIVTSFKSQAYPQGDSWAGFLGFPGEKAKLDEIIRFGNVLMRTTDGNSLLSVLVGNFLPPDNSPGVLAVVFHNGSQAEGEEVFRSLLDLEPVVNTTSMLPYTELNLMFNKQPRGPKDRHLFGGANFTLPLDPADGRDLCRFFWQTTRNPENTTFRASSMGLEFHPTQKIRQVRLEDTAYANRGQYCSVCITVNWTDETQDEEARALSKLIGKYIAERVGYKGDAYSDGSGTYVNYFSSKTKAEKAYGPNTARLRELKLKYDPTSVFKKIIDLSQ